MSKPYYQDDLVTLYHGDALDVLPELPTETVDALLTDPPYFNVKDDEWDRQWSERAHFLTWLGSALDVTRPALKASASIWVFASPALTSTIELSVVAPRFRVLNSIRWVKENGWHQKAEIAAQRRYLTAWEGIIFAEPFGSDGSALRGSGWDSACAELRAGVFEPLRSYLEAERSAAGVSNREVDKHLGTNGMAGHYFGASQWALPTAGVYQQMRELFNRGNPDGHLRREYGHLRREYEDLRREYEDLRREYEDLRRPFGLDRKRGPVTDVWNFPTVAPYPGKHPCEKPESLLAHMVTTSSRAGDVILDPFTGSGSTLVTAKNLGRKAIGIELDERYCEIAARRLCQDVLDFGEPA